VETAELDIAIDELELRVERLRALYEQYFMGIEKIPPSVAQKDVDRRVYVLRREQIRNTARRFKLQTIIQRYNTFQQYWMRITREIENGTYRRHVLRAERTVGVTGLLTAAERKRLGLPEPEPSQDKAENAPGEHHETASSTPEEGPPTTRSPSSLAPPVLMSPAAVRSQIERDLGLLLDDSDELSALKKIDLGGEFDDPLLSSLPPAPRKKKPSVRSPRRHTEPPSSRRGRARPSGVPDSTRTAQGLGPVTPRSQEPSTPPSRRSNRADRVFSLEPLRATLADSGTAPRGATSPTATRGLRLPAQSAIAGRGLPPKAPPIARPLATQSRVAPAQAPALAPTPAPHPAPTRAESPREAPKPDSIPRGLPDIRDSVIPRSNRPKAPANPPAQARQLPPLPKLESKFESASSTGLDPRKVGTLAEKLRAARKQTQENSPVSEDALAKKLNATAAELQKTHPGKRIDFDVVIKDGKAIVKPIVR
jgi:hypothetical protein